MNGHTVEPLLQTQWVFARSFPVCGIRVYRQGGIGRAAEASWRAECGDNKKEMGGAGKHGHRNKSNTDTKFASLVVHLPDIADRGIDQVLPARVLRGRIILIVM